MKKIDTIFPGLKPSLVFSIQNRLELFNASLRNHELELDVSTDFEKELVRALFFSEYIAKGITKYPNILLELIESTDLTSSYHPDTYKDKLEQAELDITQVSAVKKALFDTKLYETIRIAWRDLNQNAFLEETLEDLSNLADAIVQKAVECLYQETSQRHGLPEDDNNTIQELIVLGMGKLGAGELNFSSDIDLIFVYPSDGMTNGDHPVSNGEFFTKVCKNFIKFFSTGSHEINLYRVDTRLRPFGDAGPLVMSAEAFEEYYQSQGREWERYAMIKARPVAGDIQAGHVLLKRLNAFIYRRYFDYGSFDSFRDMKQRISLQVKNKRLENNIKLGAGGIREIEFFGQLFQLIRGGVEPHFQERKILKVLDVLQNQTVISPKTYSQLKEAYVFLRLVENRLQAYADLQTHDIPATEDARTILALSMGYQNWTQFEKILSSHMAQVHHHFSLLLVTDQEDEPEKEMEELKQMWININDPQFVANEVAIEGFEDPKSVLNLLRSLASHPHTLKMSPAGRQKLANLVPILVQKVGKQPDANAILVKLIDLIITIERRTCYLSLLIENTTALDALITLARKSPWIVSFLSSHPALLDELVHPETLYSPPSQNALEKEVKERMERLASSDIEYLIEDLNVFRQVNTLRVAAADISGHYPLMKVSDHLTYIAQAVLSQVLAMCFQTLVKKYGLPAEVKGKSLSDCGVVIVAYGKAGGFEMGYKSDIDLVFLHTPGAGITSGTDKQIDATTFYSNLGQRIIHALTVHTAAGTLYGADMRLRPGGNSGPIVSTMNAFEDYMEQDAWTWEHQALIRARPVAGDKGLFGRFEKIRKQMLTKKRDKKQLQIDVSDMRERMRKQRLKKKIGFLDLKQSHGGIVDIEFLVQFLILKHAHQYPEISVWTDNIRLLESLNAHDVITAEQSEQLQTAYVVMRKAIHRRNLQEKDLLVPEEYYNKFREPVIRLYNKFLG